MYGSPWEEEIEWILRWTSGGWGQEQEGSGVCGGMGWSECWERRLKGALGECCGNFLESVKVIPVRTPSNGRHRVSTDYLL